MGNFTFVLTLTLKLMVLSGVSLFVLQDWDRADGETVRLAPGAVPNIRTAVGQELDRRGCSIPQSFSIKVPHNVIRGRFTPSSQHDVAVLCSRDRVSSILVFRGGLPSSVEELGSGPDKDYLQDILETG